jgi:hypothetical protein
VSLIVSRVRVRVRVRGQRSGVRGQGTGVRGQGSGVRGQCYRKRRGTGRGGGRERDGKVKQGFGVGRLGLRFESNVKG